MIAIISESYPRHLDSKNMISKICSRQFQKTKSWRLVSTWRWFPSNRAVFPFVLEPRPGDTIFGCNGSLVLTLNIVMHASLASHCRILQEQLWKSCVESRIWGELCSRDDVSCTWHASHLKTKIMVASCKCGIVPWRLLVGHNKFTLGFSVWFIFHQWCVRSQIFSPCSQTRLQKYEECERFLSQILLEKLK